MEKAVSEQELQSDVQSIQHIPIVPTLLDVICRTTGMGFAAVTRVTEKRWITCSVLDEIMFGLKPGDELKVETTICHEIRQSREPVIIDNVAEDNIYCGHHTPATYGFQSYISVPIFRKDGSFFGTLCSIDPRPAKLNVPEVKNMFKLFADLISFHLQAIEQLEESELKLFNEREERTKVLEQKNMELQLMNTELESFAYVASHDLQEPLRKIQTFSNTLLIKEHDNLSENGKQYFDRMLKSVERMQQLVEDLLAYTNVNNRERIFENIPLKPIAEEIRKDYKDDIDNKNIVIEIGELCNARVIPSQMQQLFQNLIANSVKFSRPGVKPVIQITGGIKKDNGQVNNRLLPGKNYCHMTVTDNGIGFEPEYSEQIFKIFKRLHGKEEYNGTGIGLAIVKKIIDNHKGFITATGNLNEGASFDIYLPQF